MNDLRYQEKEYTVIDPAAGVFFKSSGKYEDIKAMLESNKDSIKLDGMKRVITLIAKGHNASDLFAAVVKNVVSKDIELKKLVYSYLERYAEEKEDLALLSISTFQRALKEPNQLIRASALRVLSGIRVKMITPIVLIAIREAVADMSPYVRKTAAHAIPKLYNLDDKLKPDLVLIIEKLLLDKTVLVIGSAVMAFTKVCPERIELLHKIYRKLCIILADVDEWGQVIIINMLTRYVRTQFINAVHHEDSSKLNADHSLLLRCAKPLLQSRNSAVIMAVAQMYHYIGIKVDKIPAIKALIRLLRSHAEIQELVLQAIVTMSVTEKGAFDFYIKSFFVHTSDSTPVKILKLTILTNIVNESNISTILKEFTSYINSSDDKFIAATIQAIGHCASTISLVTDACLNGLIGMLSNGNEIVVAESIVIIKRLLQTNDARIKDTIRQMIKLMDIIVVPQARASIIWLIGEYSNDIPSAMNALKKLAKSFTSEEDVVKLQILNLCLKLHIINKTKYDLIAQYLFNLAKYDHNYDVRDRARLLRNFIDNPKNPLLESAVKIFLSSKPAPTYVTNEEINSFQLGTISHFVNMCAHGYEALPEWAEEETPNTIRDDACAPNLLANQEEQADSEPLTDYTDDLDEYDSGTGISTNSSPASTSVVLSDNSVILSDNSENESINEDVKESAPQSNLDLLSGLEISDYNLGPILTPTMEYAAYQASRDMMNAEIKATPAHVSTKSFEALDKMNGRGLSIVYRFTRNPHLYSPNMVNINLLFTNNSTEDIMDIKIGGKTLAVGMSVHEFAPIKLLSPSYSLPGTIGINFNDSLHALNLMIVSSLGLASISITAPVGELLRPVTMTENVFLREQKQLKGMNEHAGEMKIHDFNLKLQQQIYEAANLGSSPSSDETVLRFSGKTMATSSLVLVSLIKSGDTDVQLVVNCDKLVVGSMLLKELMIALQ